MREREYLGAGLWVGLPDDPKAKGVIVIEDSPTARNARAQQLYIPADILGTLKDYVKRQKV